AVGVPRDRVRIGAVSGDGLDDAAEGVDLRARGGVPVARIARGFDGVGAAGRVVLVVGVALPGRGDEVVGVGQCSGNAVDDALLGAVGKDRADDLAARIVVHAHL